jgi:hypothetical protein
MNFIKKTSILLLLALMLAGGCSTVEVTDYKDFQPEFIPEEFFNGQLTAHGIVKDRSGKMIRHFNADIVATWVNGQGTLEEDFIFDDGERQRRVWRLISNGEHHYTATAGDVVGEGDLSISGNSMFLNYILRVPYDGDFIDLKIDDRMYLVSPTVLINESSMSKFGVEVGSLSLVIIKQAKK